MCLSPKNSTAPFFILPALQLGQKVSWFVNSPQTYKRFVYEDIFIRKYINSFFLRYSKLHRYRTVGSVYVFRTRGKLHVEVFFFYPEVCRAFTRTVGSRKKHSSSVKVTLQSFPKMSPISKYRKQLIALVCFYQLESLLNMQVFFRFRNIVSSSNEVSSKLAPKVIRLFSSKLSYLRNQVREEVFSNTLLVLFHTFKSKYPDGLLLANYIASVLPTLSKHTAILSLVRKFAQAFQKIFVFSGIRILLSGKLNGLSRSQSKQIQVGRVTLRSDCVPYITGMSSAFTRSGKIGIKVWFCS